MSAEEPLQSTERWTTRYRWLVAFTPLVAYLASLVLTASVVPGGVYLIDSSAFGAAAVLAGAVGLAIEAALRRGRTPSTLVLVAPFVLVVILLGPFFRSPLALANSDYRSPFATLEEIFRDRTVAWALVRATGTAFTVSLVAILLARTTRRGVARGAGAWIVLALLAGVLCVVGSRLGALETLRFYRGRVFDRDDVEFLERWSFVESASLAFDALVVVTSLVLAFRWRGLGARMLVVPIVAFAAAIALQRTVRFHEASELEFARATSIAAVATPIAWCDLHGLSPIDAAMDIDGRILSADGQRPIDAKHLAILLRGEDEYDPFVVLADRNLRGPALRALIRRPTGRQPIRFEARFGPLAPSLDDPSLLLRTLPYLGATFPMRVQCEVPTRPLERVLPARTFEVLHGGALREIPNRGDMPPFDRYYALRVTDETSLEDLARALARFGRWGPHPPMRFADELLGPSFTELDHGPYVELDGT